MFLNSLASIALKKSGIQNTDDFENFLNKPCKFMLIYRVEANELENPSYILFQIWNDVIEKWSDVKLYKVNDDIKKFFDKLGSSKIEILDDGKGYIYDTSNGGNEWVLQNVLPNGKFKKIFRKEEFEKFITENKFRINII